VTGNCGDCACSGVVCPSGQECKNDDGECHSLTSNTGGGGTGGGGNGGSGGSGSAAAMTFCMTYQTNCMFGGAMRYASMSDCISMFDASDDKACRMTHLMNVVNHVGMANHEDYQDTHCPHATGIGMCTN
jgi:hypothetical protein